MLKRLNTIFEELLVLRFTTYYKIRQSVVTIYDSLHYYTSQQHVITIYDRCVITIHDTCYYISLQVLQYMTSVITIHDRYYNSRQHTPLNLKTCLAIRRLKTPAWLTPKTPSILVLNTLTPRTLIQTRTSDNGKRKSNHSPICLQPDQEEATLKTQQPLTFYSLNDLQTTRFPLFMFSNAAY